MHSMSASVTSLTSWVFSLLWSTTRKTISPSNVYGEKDDIEEFKRRLSRECYVQRLAYRLTKAPKDEWSDTRQEYIVGYFNGMAANEPNTPDITDMGSIGMYDGYMDVNSPENRDYGR